MQKRPMLIAAGLIGLCSAPLLGQEPGRNWFTPRFGEQRASASYDLDTYFKSDVKGQRTRLHLARHDFRFLFPVHQDDANEWIVNGQVKALTLNGRPWLSDTFSRLPETYWDLRIGGTYRHRFDNGWIAGGNLTVGSASDRPFDTIDEWIVTGTGFLRIPHGERNGFLIYANYSNVREFLPHVPIPGAGYQFEVDDRLRGLVGVPFNSVSWEPIDRLKFEASYLIPRTVHSQISYRVVDPVKIYAGFDWDSDRFFRAGRSDSQDRVSYYEKRVVGGVRWDISRNVWLDFAGGFAFDRFIFEGHDYGDRDNRVGIESGPMLMLELGLRL